MKDPVTAALTVLVSTLLITSWIDAFLPGMCVTACEVISPSIKTIPPRGTLIS